MRWRFNKCEHVWISGVYDNKSLTRFRAGERKGLIQFCPFYSLVALLLQFKRPICDGRWGHTHTHEFICMYKVHRKSYVNTLFRRGGFTVAFSLCTVYALNNSTICIRVYEFPSFFSICKTTNWCLYRGVRHV